MSFKNAEAAVRAYFNTKWAGATPIAWPDDHFNPPNNDTWVRFSMKNNVGFQASIGSPGNNKFRRQGIITIQIFQKAGQRSIDAREKADLAASIFISPNKLAGFTFRNVNARDIGPDGAKWYQWNVTAEYEYDIIA